MENTVTSLELFAFEFRSNHIRMFRPDSSVLCFSHFARVRLSIAVFSRSTLYGAEDLVEDSILSSISSYFRLACICELYESLYCIIKL